MYRKRGSDPLELHKQRPEFGYVLGHENFDMNYFPISEGKLTKNISQHFWLDFFARNV